MNKMKTLKIIFIALMISIFGITISYAGSPQSYRWEGLALGLGAAIIGSHIFRGGMDDRDSEYHHGHRRYGKKHRHWRHRQYRPGYGYVDNGCWTYDRVYIPGKYIKEYINGRWVTIEVTPDRWVEKRIWDEYCHR